MIAADSGSDAVDTKSSAGARVSDVELSAGPRRFGALFWRWTARVLLVLLVMAGANQLFVRPFVNTPSPALEVKSGIDPALAAQVAARYAADYLTYDSAAPDDQLTAATTTQSRDSNVPGRVWTGPGSVIPDVVQPGRVTTLGADRAVVAVSARLRLTAAPAAATQTPASPTQAKLAPTFASLVWISMTVLVEATSTGLRVPAAGGVFSNEQPNMIAPGPGGPDAATTTATADAVALFFANYATSTMSYLVPPGASMTGLSGAVTFVSVGAWSAAGTAPGGDTAPSTDTVGAAAVTWQLAGTDLRVTQRYALSMTSSQGRWYVTAVAPTDDTNA